MYTGPLNHGLWLRLAVLRVVADFIQNSVEVSDGRIQDLIGNLFGFEDWIEMRNAHIEQGEDGPVASKLRSLIGPNGYIIFKAMQAKHNINIKGWG